MRLSKVRAGTIIEGYNAIGCDAFNVGSSDMAAGLPYLLELKKSAKFPFLSSNLVSSKGRKLVFDSSVIVERGKLKFGILGLTTSVPPKTVGVELLDPKETAAKVLKDITRKTDYQIVLLNGTTAEAETLRKSLPEADYIFLSGDEMSPGNRKTTEGTPYLYHLGKQGKSLAVVTIHREKKGEDLVDLAEPRNRERFLTRRLEFLGKADTTKSLEALYKDDAKKLKLVADLAQDLKETREKMAATRHWSDFEFVSMNKDVPDDPVMLEKVTAALAECAKISIPDEKVREALKQQITPEMKARIEASLPKKIE